MRKYMKILMVITFLLTSGFMNGCVSKEGKQFTKTEKSVYAPPKSPAPNIVAGEIEYTQEVNRSFSRKFWITSLTPLNSINWYVYKSGTIIEKGEFNNIDKNLSKKNGYWIYKNNFVFTPPTTGEMTVSIVAKNDYDSMNQNWNFYISDSGEISWYEWLI